MKRMQWLTLFLLGSVAWAHAQVEGEPLEMPNIAVDEDTGVPSVFVTPDGGATLDGPSVMSTTRPPSVLPGLKDKPEMPKLSEAQTKQVAEAVAFAWNDMSERKVAVVQIEPNGDFVQLIGMNTGLALDYPLATDRQKLLAKSIFEVLAKHGFTPTKRDLGDGQQALQVPITSSREDAIDAVAVILKKGFSIQPEAALKVITGEQ